MQDGKHNTPLVFEKHTEQILYHKPKLLCFSNLIDETISYVLLQWTQNAGNSNNNLVTLKSFWLSSSATIIPQYSNVK